MILSTFAMVYAKSGCETLKSRNYDIQMYGYIDLVYGGIITRDDWYYRVVLSGSDVSTFFPKATANLCLVIKNDDYETIKTVKPYNGNKSISGSVTSGRGNFFGTGTLKCYGESASFYCFR